MPCEWWSRAEQGNAVDAFGPEPVRFPDASVGLGATDCCRSAAPSLESTVEPPQYERSRWGVGVAQIAVFQQPTRGGHGAPAFQKALVAHFPWRAVPPLAVLVGCRRMECGRHDRGGAWPNKAMQLTPSALSRCVFQMLAWASAQLIAVVRPRCSGQCLLYTLVKHAKFTAIAILVTWVIAICCFVGCSS
jgi:hypothetical protein